MKIVPKWKVKLIIRGGFRLPETGIVEKSYRTIKRKATRSVGESPMEVDLTDTDPHILRPI